MSAESKTYELRSGKDLRAGDEEHTDEHLGRILLTRHVCHGNGDSFQQGQSFVVIRRNGLLHQTTSEAYERDSSRDEYQADPLVGVQLAAEEDDAKDPDPEDEESSCHLVDRDGGIDETDIHQGRPGQIADRRQEEPELGPAGQGEDGAVRIFSRCLCCRRSDRLG